MSNPSPPDPGDKIPVDLVRRVKARKADVDAEWAEYDRQHPQEAAGRANPNLVDLDPAAMLASMGIKIPDRVGKPRELTGCLVCDRPEDNPTAPPFWPGLCEQHRDEALMEAGRVVLSQMIPDLHHGAKPSELLPEVRDWSPLMGGVYFYGEPGRGKSYQMAALTKRAWVALGRQMGRLPRMQWRNVPTMLEDITATWGTRKSYDFAVLRYADWLVLDEFECDGAQGWAVDKLYTVVNERYERGKPTGFTSNKDMAEIHQGLSAKIASRITQMCIQVPVTGEDRRLTQETYVNLEPDGGAS